MKLMSTVVRIDDIKVVARSRRELTKIAELVASIEDVGLLQLPVVRPDMTLVSGERRLAALRKLGRTEVEVHVAANLEDQAAFLRAERDENTCREAMLPSELVALAESLREAEEANAKARQLEGGRRGAAVTNQQDQSASRPTGRQPEMSVSGTETREVLAGAVGLSRATYTRLHFIYQTAEDDTRPEVAG